jgi:hypothetical protein
MFEQGPSDSRCLALCHCLIAGHKEDLGNQEHACSCMYTSHWLKLGSNRMWRRKLGAKLELVARAASWLPPPSVWPVQVCLPARCPSLVGEKAYAAAVS